jgi:AraC family transcriptional regulator of adaptative response/methylated-DNA-[protein]-cysteine methyltransferase
VSRRPDADWTAASLTRLAGVNSTTIRRWFRDRLGLSPRAFVAACRRRRFLAELRSGTAVGDAVYASGYGSSSRVYERADTAVTPATYRKGGRGATIEWMSMASPVGTVVVAATARGVCFVAVGEDVQALVSELRTEYPHATIAEARSRRLRQFAVAAVASASAHPTPSPDLPADVVGTAFQWRVWRALCRIPVGRTLTYAQLAEVIGAPASVRAAARACATNPIALLVPCHRVVGSDGTLRGYRWGLAVKQALLDRERAANGRAR